jgi:hypothetical protein
MKRSTSNEFSFRDMSNCPDDPEISENGNIMSK